jgi:hypothetical protein
MKPPVTRLEVAPTPHPWTRRPAGSGAWEAPESWKSPCHVPEVPSARLPLLPAEVK